MNIPITVKEDFIDALAAAVAKRVIDILPKKLAAPKEDDKIFKVEELAKYLGVSKSWIHQRTARKEIPHIKSGLFLMFRKSDIDAWLDSQGVPVVNTLSTGIGKRGRI
jgi:excisionase family DNA binding protein